MNNPKLHHYIPRFWIKYYFSNSKHLFKYDLNKRKWENTNIKNTYSKHNMYKLNIPELEIELDPYIIEKHFSKVEDLFAKAITHNWFSVYSRCIMHIKLHTHLYERSPQRLQIMKYSHEFDKKFDSEEEAMNLFRKIGSKKTHTNLGKYWLARALSKDWHEIKKESVKHLYNRNITILNFPIDMPLSPDVIIDVTFFEKNKSDKGHVYKHAINGTRAERPTIITINSRTWFLLWGEQEFKLKNDVQPKTIEEAIANTILKYTEYNVSIHFSEQIAYAMINEGCIYNSSSKHFSITHDIVFEDSWPSSNFNDHMILYKETSTLSMTKWKFEKLMEDIRLNGNIKFSELIANEVDDIYFEDIKNAESKLFVWEKEKH